MNLLTLSNVQLTIEGHRHIDIELRGKNLYNTIQGRFNQFQKPQKCIVHLLSPRIRPPPPRIRPLVRHLAIVVLLPQQREKSELVHYLAADILHRVYYQEEVTTLAKAQVAIDGVVVVILAMDMIEVE